jgi:hypothetical protein
MVAVCSIKKFMGNISWHTLQPSQLNHRKVALQARHEETT